MTHFDTLASQLKALRAKHRMSQRELAAHLDVTVQTVSNWETERTQPYPRELPALKARLRALARMTYAVPRPRVCELLL